MQRMQVFGQRIRTNGIHFAFPTGGQLRAHEAGFQSLALDAEALLLGRESHASLPQGRQHSTQRRGGNMGRQRNHRVSCSQHFCAPAAPPPQLGHVMHELRVGHPKFRFGSSRRTGSICCILRGQTVPLGTRMVAEKAV